MFSSVRFVQLGQVSSGYGMLVLVRLGYIWLGHVSTGYVPNSRFSSG